LEVKRLFLIDPQFNEKTVQLQSNASVTEAC